MPHRVHDDAEDSDGRTETESRKDDDEIYYEAYNTELLRWFIQAIKNQDTMRRARSAVLNRHFGELNISVKLEEQEKSLLINEYINKEFVYPSVFLGSSLGFNKNNWNKHIEKMLERFDLRHRPVFGVKENCFLFEKLKFLLLKYMERAKK